LLPHKRDHTQFEPFPSLSKPYLLAEIVCPVHPQLVERVFCNSGKKLREKRSAISYSGEKEEGMGG